MVMIAGPNGSGKTTLTRHLVMAGVSLGTYINADDIAATLPKGATRDYDAQQEALRRRKDCIARGESFAFETVMSHLSRIEEMHEARTAGFEIIVLFVGLEDPDLNVLRVAQRVDEGGHDVPDDRIVARYFRTMNLLSRAIMSADTTLLFDNSDSRQGLRLFCICQRVPEPFDYSQKMTYAAVGEFPDWFKAYGFGK
jgi:predicted ABC-type ATPase